MTRLSEVTLLRRSRQALPGHLEDALLGVALPCQARLPGKGGSSPGGILLFWLDLGPLEILIPCP